MIQNSTIIHAALGFALVGLAACQAFEPSVHMQQQAPREPREALRPTLTLPPPVVEPEPDFALPPALKRGHLPVGEPVQLEFRDTPLAEVIHHISRAAGINVYLDAALDTRVDVTFPRITLDDALQVLLTRNSLMLVEDPPGMFWITGDGDNQPSERRFKLRSARAAEVEPNLKALIPAGAQIVVDSEQNFVMVRGKRADVEFVAQYLDAADRLKQQVLIEMRIVEVTLDERFEIGVQHDFNGIDVGNDSVSILQQFATTTGEFSLNFQSANGVVDSTLEALGRYAGVELLSSPRVVAVNNTQALIEIIREVPYIQSTTNVTSGTSGGVGTSSTQEVAFKPVGVKLQVTPAIRAGGVIEFNVTQDLSEVAEFLNGVPAVDRRTLTSRFQVRDGETLVVGGLMQDRKSKADRGIPFLMDIPFLGALFKSKEDRLDKREMLVFLSPRIITLDETSGVTDSWRQVLDSRRREMGLEPKVLEERRAASEEAARLEREKKAAQAARGTDPK
ncbi:MAG: hypothetical protein JNL28_01795 [Planctomycetes bacterium]|nr:hypothetical protein [Planctomycetota bacterium]